MPVDPTTIDPGMVLAVAGLTASLLSLAATIRQHRRELRRVIADIRVTNRGLDIRSRDLQLTVEHRPSEADTPRATGRDTESQARGTDEVKVTDSDEPLLRRLDRLLARHATAEPSAVAKLRSDRAS